MYPNPAWSMKSFVEINKLTKKLITQHFSSDNNFLTDWLTLFWTKKTYYMSLIHPSKTGFISSSS